MADRTCACGAELAGAPFDVCAACEAAYRAALGDDDGPPQRRADYAWVDALCRRRAAPARPAFKDAAVLQAAVGALPFAEVLLPADAAVVIAEPADGRGVSGNLYNLGRASRKWTAVFAACLCLVLPALGPVSAEWARRASALIRLVPDADVARKIWIVRRGP